MQRLSEIFSPWIDDESLSGDIGSRDLILKLPAEDGIQAFD